MPVLNIDRLPLSFEKCTRTNVYRLIYIEFFELFRIYISHFASTWLMVDFTLHIFFLAAILHQKKVQLSMWHKFFTCPDVLTTLLTALCDDQKDTKPQGKEKNIKILTLKAMSFINCHLWASRGRVVWVLIVVWIRNQQIVYQRSWFSTTQYAA